MWHMGRWDDPLVTRGGDTRSGRSSVPFRSPAVRPGTTTKPGRRGGEHFRSPGHVEPVTCLFSFIARCGRGAFQLSVLVSHVWVSSRGARPDTPVPGPYKRRGNQTRGALSKKGAVARATAVHTLQFITPRDTFSSQYCQSIHDHYEA
jgi:hypothetical protein